MTIVLPKTNLVPDEATGGLDTVAIRVPMDPVALAILTEAGIPVTAPSANPFRGLSPTRVEHIVPDILDGLTCVIDGGPCLVGVESTVVDCSDGSDVVILRPGGIARTLIEFALGAEVAIARHAERRSPGMFKKHYSPKTPVRLVAELGPFDAGICFGPPQNSRQIQLPCDPRTYAQAIYASLYALDQMGRLELLVEMPPDTLEWETVWDRLRRAEGN
jgi:L-threonylcarbamoyladenylate synthase